MRRRELLEKRARFAQHKSSAKRRGIEFKLTFDEWWALWEPHWGARGRNTGQMCMCRTLDQGAYEVGNVRIDRVEANHQERFVSNRTNASLTWQANRRIATSPMSTGQALGVTCDRPYFADPAKIMEAVQEDFDEDDMFDYSDLLKSA